MATETCPKCGLTVLDFHPSGMCWRCAEAHAPEQATAADCARCGQLYGDRPTRYVGGVPYCSECFQATYGHQYPWWLKHGLAAMLVLLVVGLWHDLPYFKLERKYLQGQRDLRHGKYEEAAKLLEEVAQRSNKGRPVLLASLAYLRYGETDKAWELVKDRNFEDEQLLSDVQVYFNKLSAAEKKLDEAREASKRGDEQQFNKLVLEAADIYPEAKWPRAAKLNVLASQAFERKDYTAFLADVEQVYAIEPNNPLSAAQVSSALAAQYAVTGDVQYKQRAEAMLTEAQSRATTDEQKKDFDEYAERIRYRLASRVIIDKDAYDKRFRTAAQKESR
jgi:hypothetical protein